MGFWFLIFFSFSVAITVRIVGFWRGDLVWGICKEIVVWTLQPWKKPKFEETSYSLFYLQTNTLIVADKGSSPSLENCRLN